MKLPVWTRPVATGAVIGAVVVSIIGFTWGGWVSASTAAKMAETRARADVVTALVPFCVARSEADPTGAETIAAIRKAESYARDDILIKAGWATMPGSDRPDRQLATACRRMIIGDS